MNQTFTSIIQLRQRHNLARLVISFCITPKSSLNTNIHQAKVNNNDLNASLSFAFILIVFLFCFNKT